ncbi:LamG-like jellyroll fold domain-containing protein [Maribacter sp. TH_r10]|uniref:LamG-like jellyroll fold domain-containing protein n=1 Tax=Maribacter sp. TH_r10 TaxID=3082086 RepID=UPI002953FD85|nr:LamG-like jellyroll fold domain-containing protein [Maribacter sp. TH_r10]MDV7139736.1 LamG-like jellyroll fold domain-containing protein [Maribacter sp. TH_r10]
MKIKNRINKIAIGLLSVTMALFLVISCDDDDDSTGSFSLTELESVISQAEALISESEEGINAGDYQPGSKAELESVVTWVNWRINNSKSQENIDDAAYKLNAAIETFLASTVSPAMPWIQQENDTYIRISDNIKTVLDGAFTIETQVYAVDLNQKGYSNNLFSAEQSGPDSGFGVRYFGTGNIQIVTGDGSTWLDSGDQAAGKMVGGEWIDLAYTNSGSEQKLYINGELVAEQSHTHLLAADVSFVIGNSPTWTDRVVNALVREFKIWDTVLDQSTIQGNIGSSVDGTEVNLECYFPFGSDLGSSFSDATGNYTATLEGSIDWVSEPPVIILDYTNLNAAIEEITEFRSSVEEGTEDGDYPVGTLDYLDELIAEANEALESEGRQTALDDMATSLSSAITLVNSMLVGDTDGIYIDRDNADAIGLQITPNYTPQGDYTVEFDVKVESLFGYGTGEFFNNGTFGVWVYGYEELTEENVLNSGGLWNFTDAGAGWQGPDTDPLAISVDQWQHVAIVHDDAARTTTLYVDGEQMGQDSDIGAPNVSGWGEIWLGNGWGKMDGFIKDFRLWDVARSQGELDAEISGNETGLHIYFPLDKVNGVKFVDETGNYSAEMRGIEWNN